MAEARSIHSFFLTAPNQHRPFCDLAGRTAQPCPSPALCALFPHPLQNRVPRGERAPVALRREPVSAPAPVGAGRSPPGSSTRAGRRDQVLLPLPKIARLLLQWRCFLSLGGTSWQQGAPAGSPAVRVVGRWSPVATAQRRPRRQPRQVRLSISIMLWRSYPPFLCSIASFLTRPQPFPSPPAPKTHPVSPFSGFSGCVFLFFAVFGVQNFCLLFCASCRIAVTS